MEILLKRSILFLAHTFVLFFVSAESFHSTADLVRTNGDFNSHGSAFSRINYKYVKKYRGLHKNATGIALCYGKSLDLYKHRSEDEAQRPVIVAGNNLVFRSGVPIDYLFLGVAGRGRKRGYDTSYFPNKKEIDAFQSCRKKFFVTYRNEKSSLSIFPSKRDVRAERYEVDKERPFTSQLDTFPFGMYGSTTQMHAVMQFLLFSGVQHIVLVGCDSANTGYAKKIRFKKRGTQKFVKAGTGWEIMAKFINSEYPKTTITVHNPVGLKNMSSYGWGFSFGKFAF